MRKDNFSKDKILHGEILEAHEYREAFEGAEENQQENAKKVEDGFWRVLAKASKHISQIEQFVAAYYCAFDENTPNKVRVILMAALAYFVMPLDMVPDFLAGFGFTDDLAVLTVALNTIQNAIKPHHVEAAKAKLASMDEISQ